MRRLNRCSMAGASCSSMCLNLSNNYWGWSGGGGKIHYQNGEHDDFANAVSGVLVEATQASRRMDPKLVRFCLQAGAVDEDHPDPLYARRPF